MKARTYKCRFCGEIFMSMKTRREHVMQAHRLGSIWGMLPWPVVLWVGALALCMSERAALAQLAWEAPADSFAMSLIHSYGKNAAQVGIIGGAATWYFLPHHDGIWGKVLNWGILAAIIGGVVAYLGYWGLA